MDNPRPRATFHRRIRRVRRAVLVRRRALSGVAAAVAVLLGLQAAAPEPDPTALVVAATRDLPAGTVIGAGDVAVRALPPDAVPAGALVDAAALLGRTSTGPVREGEVLTDVRVVSGTLLEGYPGRVAAPVRIADAGAVSLLRVGDTVDVVAADPQGRREAVTVAERAAVVALPRAPGSALATGGLLVLAVTDDTARALAAAAVSGYLSVVLAR